MNILQFESDKFDLRNPKELVAFIFHGTTFCILSILIVAGTLFGYGVYSVDKNVEVRLVGAEGVTEGSQIKISFSTKMLRKSVEEGLRIEPALETSIRWINDRELILIPKESTLPDTEYVITFDLIKTSWFVPVGETRVVFCSPKVPKIISVSPVDGQVGVDYGESIVFDFEEPLSSDYSIEVKINPLTGFVYDFNEDRTQLALTPKDPMSKNQKYVLSVVVKHVKDENLNKKIHESNFVTKVPPQIVYGLDRNGNPTKTEEQMEIVSAKITEGKYIHIDISSQAMFIFEDGIQKGAFKVSTGLRGMDTPIGTHKVLAKSRRPWSNKYKLYMPWFIQFTYDGHGIHELPEWPGGIKEGEAHLGIPVSHGCVRLGVGPAKVVYDFAQVGNLIVIER